MNERVVAFALLAWLIYTTAYHLSRSSKLEKLLRFSDNPYLTGYLTPMWSLFTAPLVYTDVSLMRRELTVPEGFGDWQELVLPRTTKRRTFLISPQRRAGKILTDTCARLVELRLKRAEHSAAESAAYQQLLYFAKRSPHAGTISVQFCLVARLPCSPAAGRKLFVSEVHDL